MHGAWKGFVCDARHYTEPPSGRREALLTRSAGKRCAGDPLTAACAPMPYIGVDSLTFCSGPDAPGVLRLPLFSRN